MLPALMALAQSAFNPNALRNGAAVILSLDASKSPMTLLTCMAAQFTALNLEYLSHAGNADLRGAVTGWWRSGWMYMDSASASMRIIDCYTGSNTGYHVRASAAANRVFAQFGNGTAATSVTDTTPIVTATWYNWQVWLDSGGFLNISVNNSTPSQSGASAVYVPGSAGFFIGSTPTPSTYWDGRQQQVMGGDGNLTPAQRAAIFNSGTPLRYSQLLGYGIAPSFYFPLDETSGSRIDAVNGLSLNDNNTVTNNPGIINDGISQINDLSGFGRHMIPPAATQRPVIHDNDFNRLPSMWFDGVNSELRLNSVATLYSGLQDVPISVVALLQLRDTSGTQEVFQFGPTASANLQAASFNVTHWRIRKVDDAALAKNAQATAVANTSPHVVVWASDTLANIFEDGVQVVANGDVDVGVMTLSLFRISGAARINGNMRSLVAYSVIPTPYERKQLERYMSRQGLVKLSA